MAPSLGVELRAVDATDAGEIERTLAAFARFPNVGLVVTPSATVTNYRLQAIVAIAARYKLPAVYGFRLPVISGGLISYGPNRVDPFRRAAEYVDRILKGENPADMPVQAPTKYDLVINLKTARALSLTMPPSLLGARAEKQSFDVMVEQSLDPAAGKADLFPQEITRVLLNLISNGVYATAKKAQADGASYKPTLTASTKSLGDRVEIKIRDNGTGIPPEIKDKMFNPFFTTKPAGEGTGLGLSISHDIVVKQHGGSIDVDTLPGEFTEIRIVLPREAVFLPDGRA